MNIYILFLFFFPLTTGFAQAGSWDREKVSTLVPSCKSDQTHAIRTSKSARTGDPADPRADRLELVLTNRLKLSLAQTVEMCLELLYRSCRSPLPRRAPSGARCILDCRDGRAQGRGGPRFTPRYSYIYMFSNSSS